MAKKNPDSLFRRLTRLFRSGPVVKRKIRALDTAIAVADKTKSSGTLLFQKSLSPTYATITANAYNLSERLMRYQDFQEMEYSVHGGQLIATLDAPDGFIRIDELAAQCAIDPEKTFVVYSYDHAKKKIVPSIGKQARQTCVDHAWKVTFDNGTNITASPEHRLMLRDGSYKKVEDLQPGDAMMPFYRKDLFATAKTGTKGYRWVYTMDSRFRGWTKEHQLVAEWVEGRELTRDEVVHHINFDKTDNRPENLLVMTKSDHDSYHAALNNEKKWTSENIDWIESFKKRHAVWMRDHAPTARHDVTFGKILQACENVGFSISKVANVLGVHTGLINDRLVAQGFRNFTQFVDAYSVGGLYEKPVNPGRLTRELTIDEILSVLSESDTKRSMAIKLGCTVNVFDKFLNRRVNITWSQLRERKGFKNFGHEHRTGGRPKGSNLSALTYQQICNAYAPGLTLPRLSETLGVNKNTIISRLAQNGFQKYSDFTKQYDNCKVVSIEYAGVMPLYDLTVDGYKNFATDSVISHNTAEIASAMDIYADEACAQDDRGRVLHIYSDNEKIRELLEDLFYGNLNVEFNLRSWVRNLPLRGNTVIPLLDGRNIPLAELSRELEGNPDSDCWVYSIKEDNGSLVPGRVRWCGLTRKASDLVRVWLDDETYVDCTPDHEFILRDGNRRPAQHLQPGMSLMPFYRSRSSRTGAESQLIEGYERVYDPRLNKQIYTHRVMAQHAWRRSDVGKVVHHVNFDRHDNRPSNLRIMSKADHIELHRGLASAYNSSELHKQHNTQRSAAMKCLWRDPVRKKAVCENMALKFDERCLLLALDHVKKSGRFIGSVAMSRILRDDDKFNEYFSNLNRSSNRDLRRSLNDTTIRSLFQRETGMLYHDVIASHFPGVTRDRGYKIASKGSETKRNHKVLRVERLDDRDDVYCMEVTGPNGQHDRHNFMILSQTTSGETSESGVCVSNCKYGDFFLYNDVHPEYGVINAFPIPVNEIEREENFDRDDPFAVRYRWVTLGNRTLENWEVTHFRLLGNDMFLPYGSSMVEPARRIWRQLILIEDAMLVYRVVRAPDRRVFYIDVANVPPEGVEPYVEEQKKRLRNSSVIDNTTGRVDLRYNPLSVDEDYIIPVRGSDSGTKIDTLAGGTNTGTVEDVEYIQKKLFAALKIPRAYLGYDEMLSSKATLAQEDIRFSRSVGVIQKTIIAELNKLAIIHLYANGFVEDDLVNFTLRMSNPSTVAQQQKLELWRAMFEIAGSIPEGMGSKRFVYKRIWNLTDDEIDEIDEDRLREKIVEAMIEGAGGEGGEGGVGGGGGGGGDLFGGAGLGGGGEGEDFDAGGGDLGDLGDIGGDEGGAAEEEPPEENAGEEPEEKEDELELLTSSEDADDEERFRLPNSEFELPPVKPTSRLRHALYNRGRRRTHGASRTHEPDFVKMTGVDSESMKDPYDNNFLKALVSNPMGESRIREQPVKSFISPDMQSILRRMSIALNMGPGASQGVLIEGDDIQDEIDRGQLAESTEFDFDLSSPSEDEEVVIIEDYDPESRK